MNENALWIIVYTALTVFVIYFSYVFIRMDIQLNKKEKQYRK